MRPDSSQFLRHSASQKLSFSCTLAKLTTEPGSGCMRQVLQKPRIVSATNWCKICHEQGIVTTVLLSVVLDLGRRNWSTVLVGSHRQRAHPTFTPLALSDYSCTTAPPCRAASCLSHRQINRLFSIEIAKRRG